MRSVKRGKKLFEIVIEEIKVLIESDNLQPGDKLPTEKEVIDILNVSRTSLREALTVLQNSGHLEIIQGKGIFLVKRMDTLEREAIVEDDEKLLDYLHEARVMIESQLAMLAAKRATNEDKGRMAEALARMENERNHAQLKDRIQADYDFHYSMADGAKNPILKDMLKQIDEKLYTGRRVTLSFPKGREKAVKAHRLIYEAICRQDADRAREEMRKHIEEVNKAHKTIHVLKQEEEK